MQVEGDGHLKGNLNESHLPCVELRRILCRAYSPCACYERVCRHHKIRWVPEAGHIPRGCFGALGRLDQVRLVLVVAEPGNPQPDEAYCHMSRPEQLLDAACSVARECLLCGRDEFHVNIRAILDLCWPGIEFEEQMRRTWLTESCLCSADKECGSIKSEVTDACGSEHLKPQLDLLANAQVIALGEKAQRRTKKTGHRFIPAYAAAPPGSRHKVARESWEQATAAFRHWVSGCRMGA